MLVRVLADTVRTVITADQQGVGPWNTCSVFGANQVPNCAPRTCGVPQCCDDCHQWYLLN